MIQEWFDPSRAVLNFALSYLSPHGSSYSGIAHPGLSIGSRWNLGPESPQRVTTNYQTRLGGGDTLRIARLRLAGRVLLLGGDQDRSRGRHTEIDGHRAWMRGEVGEGSRQRVVIKPPIEEIVHVSTVSFAAELNRFNFQRVWCLQIDGARGFIEDYIRWYCIF